MRHADSRWTGPGIDTRPRGAQVSRPRGGSKVARLGAGLRQGWVELGGAIWRAGGVAELKRDAL